MKSLQFRQVHLDFHTSEKIINVGERFNSREFVKVLKDAHVNSVTCFAKCHHGMIYYDTKFPAHHPGLSKDLLREQIEACHAEGIRVPIYISVQFDEFMAKRHSEWLQLDSGGKSYGAGPFDTQWKILCLNTPYVEYIEEQIDEIFEKFGDNVDGFFFDIINQQQCCCKYCMEGMERDGLNPESILDRKGFAAKVAEGFKKKISALVRSYNPNCTIFFNSGHVGPQIRKSLDCYSHLELESLPGGKWGYDHFPITVAYAKNLGKEYLGMTGRFHKSWADFGGFKNQPALEYECFRALANGAKCSIGDQLHPSGYINKATYDLIGSVYKKVKEREEWCENLVPVSQIGLYTPETAEESSEELHPSIKGAYRMLSESHFMFDIIDDKIDFGRYQLIILPDVITLNDSLKEKLESYIKKGGHLLLSYKSAVSPEINRFLLEDTGLLILGESEYCPNYIVAGVKLSKGIYDTEYVLYERGLKAGYSGKAEKLASIWNPYFNRNYKHFCSHFQTPVEKDSGDAAIVRMDNIIYFSHPIFSMYSKHGMNAYKQLVINSIHSLIGDSIVCTNAPTTAQVNLSYQPEKDRYVLHMLHYIPERRYDSIDTIEDIIPLYNIELKIQIQKLPKAVYCAPENRSLDFCYQDGKVYVKVPEVRGHQIIVIE